MGVMPHITIALNHSFTVVCGVLGMVALWWLWTVVRWYVVADRAGVPIEIMTLLAMRLRRVPVSGIVIPYIVVVRDGLKVSISSLESHFLLGGDVEQVVAALVCAKRQGIKVSFQKAAKIDLAGEDVFKVLQIRNSRSTVYAKLRARYLK